MATERNRTVAYLDDDTAELLTKLARTVGLSESTAIAMCIRKAAPELLIMLVSTTTTDSK